MTIIQNNKNIIAAFILFAVLTFVLIQKFSVPQDYVEVTIIEGDTLTHLAERYAGDMPSEQWMREVSALNNLNGSVIVAGDDLKLPAYIEVGLDDTRLVLAEEGE